MKRLARREAPTLLGAEESGGRWAAVLQKTGLHPIRRAAVKRFAATASVVAMTICGSLAQLSPASASDATSVGVVLPSDPRLVPNPIEASDEGTMWKCRATGSEIQCTGSLTTSWDVQEGPGDWCEVPLYSLDGTASRTQTRYYRLDPTTGDYLEYKRLVHLSSRELLAPSPDAGVEGSVLARLGMTWLSSFTTPGDLDSRVTRKQGIDTMIKSSAGGVVLLDVGQKSTVASEDFDFKGRWDIALGDPAIEFGKVCTALGQ